MNPNNMQEQNPDLRQDSAHNPNNMPGSNSDPMEYEEDVTAQDIPKKKQSSIMVIDDNAPYRANGSIIEEPTISEEQISDQPSDPPSWEQLTKEKYAEQREKSKQTNAKVAKTAVKGAATYFGGPAGGAIADAVNNSGLLDEAYDKIADTTAKVMDSNPLARHVQNKLNEADDSGVLDAADSAISMVSGNASSAAAQGAQKASSAAQAAEAAQEGGQAASNVTKAGTSLAPSKPNNPEPKPNEAVQQNNEAAKQTQKATNIVKKDKEKKEKDKKKATLINFIKANPTLIVILLAGSAFLLLFILLMALLLGEGGALEQENAQSSSLDTRYDFTATTVTLTNSYTNVQDRVEIQELTFEELIKGAAYAELYNSLSNLSSEEMVELFSANMVVFRALALNIGGYNSSTKEIELQSGSKGIPYCNIQYGCDVISSNGVNTYLLSTYNGSFTGSKISSMDAASGDVLSALNTAYNNTKYLILVPSSFNQLLTEYNMGNPPYTQAIKQSMVNKATQNKKYDTIIKEISEYNNYKIYNLEEFAMSYTYSDNPNYWWPLGGKQDSSGLYSGTSSWTSISSPYGSRIHPITGKSSFHSGIDIPASQGTPIIATRSGTVKIATYNSSYGNYVEIDHGDGTSSRYAHMMNGGIMVSVGQLVTQGQMIGKVGTTGASTGNHLHFEIRIKGQTTNPLEYVSASNQRPKQVTTSVKGVSGSSNVQSVCLTLKEAGFSNNAVAALMSNMFYESNFRPNVLGDHGTSYGLCQWHNGRYTNLRNHCGSRVESIECQIDYLIYELKTSYKGVYSNLLSNASAYDMTNYFCLNFESPANKYVGCPRRASGQSATYLNYVNNGCK